MLVGTLADGSFAVLEKIINDWQAFVDHVRQLDLWEATSIKPLVDGRTLMEHFGKAGKWMAPAMETCLAWQLRNPQATDPTGALEEVQKRRQELGIPEPEK